MGYWEVWSNRTGKDGNTEWVEEIEPEDWGYWNGWSNKIREFVMLKSNKIMKNCVGEGEGEKLIEE